MGGFVGSKNSPFLKRRRGRIGPDVTEAITSPFGFAQPFFVVDNGVVVVASRQPPQVVYGLSLDRGETWPLAPAWGPQLGQGIDIRPPAPGRPNKTFITGGRAAVGGAATIVELDENGLNPVNTLGVLVAGIGDQFYATRWSLDGSYFFGAVTESLGVARLFYGRTPTGAPFINLTVGVGNNIFFQRPIKDLNADNDALFVFGTAFGDALYKIRIVRGVANVETVFTRAATGNFIADFCQKGSVIVAIDATNTFLRSTDYGNTWSTHTEVRAGGNQLAKVGSYIYSIQFTTTGLSRSRQGLNWEANPIQPLTFFLNGDVNFLNQRPVAICAAGKKLMIYTQDIGATSFFGFTQREHGSI